MYSLGIVQGHYVTLCSKRKLSSDVGHAAVAVTHADMPLKCMAAGAEALADVGSGCIKLGGCVQ